MDEARRFVRYVMPAIASSLLLIFYLSLSNLSFVWQLLAKLPTGVGPAIVLLLGSGGVGYLLSIVHHTLYNSRVYDCLHLVADVRPVIQSSLRQLAFANEPRANATRATQERVDLSAREAWVTLTVIWHTHLSSGNAIAAAEPRIRSLWDLMHASGTFLIGAVGAFLAWLPLCYVVGVENWWGFILATIFGILVIIGAGVNSRIIAAITRDATAGVLWRFLDSRDRPIRLWAMRGHGD